MTIYIPSVLSERTNEAQGILLHGCAAFFQTSGSKSGHIVNLQSALEKFDEDRDEQPPAGGIVRYPAHSRTRSHAQAATARELAGAAGGKAASLAELKEELRRLMEAAGALPDQMPLDEGIKTEMPEKSIR